MWIERFEARYVDVYRALLVVLMAGALIAVLFAAGNWVQTKLTYRDFKPETEFESPVWGDIRASVVPTITAEEDPKQNDASGSESKKTSSRFTQQPPLIDPRIEEIHAILSKQFTRNPDGVDKFRELVPRRFLQEILLENRLIPDSWEMRFIRDVKSLAEELAIDDRINRISSLEARAETLIISIQKFSIKYRDAIDLAKKIANQKNSQEEQRQETAMQLVFEVVPVCAGILLCIILLVVFIRIEVHLRRLAEYAERNEVRS